MSDRVYPLPRADEDPRFTVGLVIDVNQVLVEHGYPPATSGGDLVALAGPVRLPVRDHRGGRAVRRYLRRRRLRLAVTAVMTGLTVNAWIQAGGSAMLVLLLAATGCIFAVAFTATTAGYCAAKHSLQTRQAIQAASARGQIEPGPVAR